MGEIEAKLRARQLQLPPPVVPPPGVVLPFHCTAIADGSRTIAVGQAVRFSVVPGNLGRWEATQIIPL